MDSDQQPEATTTKSAVKYSRDFEIPEQFPEILRDLTREILRANPSDIERFAMEYFAAKIAERSRGEDAN